jgi:predicted amidohydrolase
MRVGYCQFDPAFGQIARNIDHVGHLFAGLRCDLMVLPELFASGYQFISKAEVKDLAEPIPDGFTTTRLLALARDCGMYLVAGLPEWDAGRFYNSAILIGPWGFIGRYRKTHLFFEETLFFSPGDTGFQVWDIGLAKIGVMICFDWYYPESSRSLVIKGAEILCHPSNLVLPHCPDAMVTRCLENRVFSITANRVGSEERGGKSRLTYIGSSEIVDPRGCILHRAPTEGDDVMVVDIDPAQARDKTLNRYNDLIRDRRSSLYEP